MAIVASGQTTIMDMNDAIISGTAPTSPTVGTLWIDSSVSPNVLKTWNGSSWVTQSLALSGLDPAANTTLTNTTKTANEAKSTADSAKSTADAAKTAATTAQSTANGKNKAYRQSTQPTGTLTAGDLWFDTANGNRVSIYDGSKWVVSQFGNAAVDNLDAGSITTGTLQAIDISASFVDSNGQVNGAYFDGDEFRFMKFKSGVSNPDLKNPNISEIEQLSKIFVDGFAYATSTSAYGLGAAGLFYEGVGEENIGAWSIGSSAAGTMTVVSDSNIDIEVGSDQTISLYGNVFLGGDLNANNHNLNNVNHITINDAGGGEGIEWLGGNGWKIVESDNNLSNVSAGALQIASGGQRRMSISTAGNVYLSGTTFKGESGGTTHFASQGAARLVSDGGAEFLVGSDGTGSRVWSMDIYNRTYSSSPNLHITSAGTLGRSTSARKYKLLEEQISEELPYNILKLNPKTWFDKSAVEQLAGAIERSEDLTDSDIPYLERIGGLIAEDVEDAGLSLFVHYSNPDENGHREVEGLMYDRLWVLLIPLVRELFNRVETLEEKLKRR